MAAARREIDRLLLPLPRVQPVGESRQEWVVASHRLLEARMVMVGMLTGRDEGELLEVDRVVALAIDLAECLRQGCAAALAASGTRPRRRARTSRRRVSLRELGLALEQSHAKSRLP